MILGSHNSWSYLPVKSWWMKPLAFTARCQSVSIQTQYEKYGVRCFDLRVKFDKRGVLQIVHNNIVYNYTIIDLYADLAWLDTRPAKVLVRVLLDVRTNKALTEEQQMDFRNFCAHIERAYSNITFWCGRNLYNWEIDYHFHTAELECDDQYASVALPKLIDDWWPWLFAYRNNHIILERGTTKDILLMDFVNIQ